MNTLSELIDDYQSIVKAIMQDVGDEPSDAGEMTALEERLNAVDLQIKSKVDSYAYVMEKLKEETEYWKSRADANRRTAKTIENSIAYIRYRLKGHIKNLNAEEVIGLEKKLRITKTAKRLVISDFTAIPEKYKYQVVTIEINKDRLKKDLTDGAEIPGAILEGGSTVRAFTNRSK